MQTLRVETVIEAPPERCFDAARDMGLHVASASETGEVIVEGRSSGLLELGESVTFEARHFGVRFRLTSRIVAFDRPHSFTDEMVRGPFAHLRHEHRFEASGARTSMIDVLEFQLPLGWLGAIPARLFVGPHLRRFLVRRGERLRQFVESRTD